MESQIQTVLSNAHYVRYSFAYFLRSQEQLGLKRFSLYGSTPHLFIDHRDFSEVEALACLLAQKGFSISAFLPANYGYSLFAQQATEHFAVSLEYYKNCVRAAKRLGAQVMCLRPQNGLLSEDPGVRMANCIAMMKGILKLAESEHMPVALGTALPASAAALHTAAELQSLLRAVDSPLLGVLLDTYVMSERNERVEEWSQRFGKRLYHVLFCDGRAGGYRIPGRGIHPMQRYYRQLLEAGYHGDATCFLGGRTYLQEPDKADKQTMQQILPKEGAGQ